MTILSAPYTGDIPVDSDNNYIYYQDGLTGEIYGVPRTGSQNSLPPYISGNTSTTGSSGGYIQQGQSWFNDLLNFGLGLAAIGNRGTIQGGAINPSVQPSGLGLNAEAQAAAIARANANNNAGANLGGSLQNFITNNTGLLLVGGLAVVLWKSGRK
jgi:hypothetical protein